MELRALKRLDARSIWKLEAADFTPWLSENLPRLGEALGMELELETIEAPVGGFSLDLLARDLGRDRTVVIENQLEQTDHDHLGKLITYASGYDASCVIWIAAELREEHRQALDWLNLHSDEDTEFFGVVVEVLQIDDSAPAVQFRPIATPNTWRKETKAKRGSVQPTPRGQAYAKFFQELIDQLREKHHYTGARSAGHQNWYAFASGVGGVYYSASFAQGAKCRTEVYIDFGDQAENEQFFDHLANNKDLHEAAVGEPLSWERLDGKRACRVAVYRPGSIDDEEQFAECREWFIEKLLRFKKVFGPEIQKRTRS